MPKDDKKDKKHARNESHTEVHVESHVESHSGDDEQVAELTADLQRLQADFANYKRRAEAEKAELLDFAKGRVVREFLEVRDSFDRELINRPPEVVTSPWAVSIDSIRQQFDKALKTLGVERFVSAGQPFDPHRHEAVVMDEGEGDHEVVAEELQPGYQLGETILRHAIVKVTKQKEPPASHNPDTHTTDDTKHNHIEQENDSTEGEL